MTKSLKGFFQEFIGWTFNWVFATVLFGAIAAPIVNEYGYSNSESSTNSEGGIESGPSGSGVFPVTFVLFLAVCGIYFRFMFNYFTNKDVDAEDGEDDKSY